MSGGSLTVTNSGGEVVYTDLLGVSAVGNGGFTVSSGSVMTLDGGSSSAMNVVYGGSTTTAGTLNGVLTLSLNSVGQALTGLGTVALAGTSVAVNATVYRPAVGALVSNGTVLANGGTVNVGNTRVNLAFGSTKSLDIRNTAVSTDVYSEKLNAVVNGVIVGTLSGGTTQLVAGGTGTGALTLGFGSTTFASAGVQSGTVSVGFDTDGNGTSGLGLLSIGTQTVQLTGTVYRLAAGSLGSSSLNLAAVRVGGTFGSGTLSVYNIASGTDAFSEKLDVNLGVSSGSATVVNGTLGLLTAGSSNASTLRVSLLNTATAGIQTGTVSVNYFSNGLGTSGLSTIDAGSATLTLSGTVYRYAAGSLSTTTLSLGTIRAGQAVSGGSLTVTNSGGESVYTDLLGVSSSATTGFILGGGGATLSGGSSGVLSVIYNGSTAAGGSLSGTLTLDLNSIGQTGLTSYGAFALAGTSVAVNATVYRPAVGALVSNGTVVANGGTVNLGGTRLNASFSTTSLDIRNTAVSTDLYSEKLNALVNGAIASGPGTGSVTQLVAGGTVAGALTLGFGSTTFSSPGIKYGTVSVGFETDGTGTSGLGTLSIGTQTVQLTGTVYRLASGSLGSSSLALGRLSGRER